MAKKSSRGKNKVSDKKTSNVLLSIIVNGMGFGILVVAGCFVYLGLFTLPKINSTTVTSLAQALADSQVSLVNHTMDQKRLRLTGIAQSEDLLSALQNDNEEQIKRYQNELSRAFPKATRVEIIRLGPLGIASLKKGSNGLHNNIELDLISRASNGETVEPEAYKHDGEWLFSIAEPVKSKEKRHADGALLVTLSGKYLRTLLSQLDSSLGDTKLHQLFNRSSHLIASTGNNPASGHTIKADVSISHWQLSFNPSQELIAAASQSAMLIWILLAAAVLALILAITVAYKKLNSTLAQELNALTGEGNKLYRFTLPGFEAKAQQIKELLTEKKVKAATGGTKSGKPAPQTKTPDPITEPTAASTEQSKPEPKTPEVTLPTEIPATIFRAYDIRGIADQQLNNDTVFAIGLAIGSEALDQGQQSVVVCADGRHSSPQIRDALVKGLLASGRDVIDIGTMPTPLMYFATHQLGTQSGVMITGSHNPPEYNGIKVVINGKALAGSAIQALRERIINKQISTGQGEYRSQDVEDAYIDYIVNDVAIAQPLKIVIDAGNGVAGNVAPRLFEELGCEVIPLYCEVDGDFPNHHPDPADAENLQDLIRTVKEQEADLGIAFDGDADRVAAVSASGVAVPADRLLMLLAQDVVSRNPGADVIFDVKCTRNINTLISNYGGRPIMWKSGHSFMKEKMAETGALLGGEFSGHIFFKERWFGFDDGMYAAARLIEILSTTDPDLDNQIAMFPESISTPELKAATTDEQKFAIIEQLTNNNDFGDGKISTLDGVRVDFSDGWGLVRASNTTPTLVLRFEADTAEALARIQEQFKTQLANVDGSLEFSF